FDMTYNSDITHALMADVKKQAPKAVCEMVTQNVNRNLIVNRDKPPFDNPKIREAMALTLDRQAFIDILSEGDGVISGAMLPPPNGVWGMPPEVLDKVFGYGDVEKNRAAARKIMESLGYGPDNRLKVKVATR